MGNKWTTFENNLSLSKIIGTFMSSGITFRKRSHSDIIIFDEIFCILKDLIMTESLKQYDNVSGLSQSDKLNHESEAPCDCLPKR